MSTGLELVICSSSARVGWRRSLHIIRRPTLAVQPGRHRLFEGIRQPRRRNVHRASFRQDRPALDRLGRNVEAAARSSRCAPRHTPDKARSSARISRSCARTFSEHFGPREPLCHAIGRKLLYLALFLFGG